MYRWGIYEYSYCDFPLGGYQSIRLVIAEWSSYFWTCSASVDLEGLTSSMPVQTMDLPQQPSFEPILFIKLNSKIGLLQPFPRISTNYHYKFSFKIDKTAFARTWKILAIAHIPTSFMEKKSPHNYGGFILHQKSCPTSRAKAQPTPHTTQALYQATEKIISKQETPHFDYILCTPTPIAHHHTILKIRVRVGGDLIPYVYDVLQTSLFNPFMCWKHCFCELEKNSSHISKFTIFFQDGEDLDYKLIFIQKNNESH